MQTEQPGSKQRAKLQDIAAHTGKTNCASIGVSGTLLVTGGDDALVNVWALGRPGVVYSLQGHTAPVTSVCYDKKEEMVLAGSQSATVKLYDLQSAKQLRTITGHRSQISALDFHPVGNWFASGSFDTNWKLWDKRQRNCTATFKGHSDSVSNLYFSPPGKWVITVSADGVVKLWDLSAGKSIAELPHAQRVTAVQFNPVECVLATACKDRMIRLWDLDRFDSFDACGPETTAAHAMAFNPDGQSLFVAYNDSLRKYGFEPTETLEHRDMSWANVLDVKVANDNVISCSVSGSTVSVWAVEASSSASHKQPQVASAPRQVPQAQGSQPDPPQQPMSVPKESHCAAVQASSSDDRHVVNGMLPSFPVSGLEQQLKDADTVFRASLHSGAVAPTHNTWKRGQPTELHPAAIPSSECGGVVHDHQDAGCSPLRPAAPAHDQQVRPGAKPTMVDAITEIGESLLRNGPAIAQSSDAAPRSQNGDHGRCSDNAQAHGRAASPSVDVFVGANVAKLTDARDPAQRPSSTPGGVAAHQQPSQCGEGPDRWEHADSRVHHVGSAANPPAYNRAGSSASPTQDDERELADILQQVKKQHQRFMSIMDTRSSGADIVRSFFEKGDIKGCLAAAQRQGDPAFAVDVFRFLASDDRPREFRLNMCPAAASAVLMCLPARPDDVVKVALQFARMVLKGFATDIQAGCRQKDPSARDPVDLKADERRANCREAKDSFMELLPELRRVLESNRPLAVKERAQDVAERIVHLAR